MRSFFTFILALGTLFASTELETSNTCKGCHPIIYSEFYNSAHRKSSIYEDEIHAAIWEKHPDKAKDRYSCAKCHTPSDVKLKDALDKGEKAVPQNNKVQVQEAISCVFCHSISDIKEHGRHNENILTDEPKMIFSADKNNKSKKVIFKEQSSFFGMFKKTTGSPFHNIDYTNENYYTAKMCMGCHSHLKNSLGQELCSVDMSGANNEKKNCITCHMPKVSGSSTTIKITKEHAYHGFAGARNKPELLAKYIKLDMRKSDGGFEITIKNEATHNLFLQPLRVAQLNVKVVKKEGSVELKPMSFVRMLGKDGKPAMPWEADSVYKDNMIKTNEARAVKDDTALQSGDTVEVQFGYYLVNPKVLKKLGLENSKEATKFRVLKTRFFTIP